MNADQEKSKRLTTEDTKEHKGRSGDRERAEEAEADWRAEAIVSGAERKSDSGGWNVSGVERSDSMSATAPDLDRSTPG